jgi:hypothetical protein
MSHNRKNIGRQFRPATESPQMTNRVFTYLVALVAAAGLLLGLILSGGSADAAATKLDCIKGLKVPGYVFVGMDRQGNVQLDTSESDTYTTAVCDNGTTAYERAVADNKSEVLSLEQYFLNSPRDGLQAFCKHHAGRAILITSPGNGLANVGKPVKIERKAAFKKFLGRYASFNQCVIG